MPRFKMEVVTAIAAWAFAAACNQLPSSANWLDGLCPLGDNDFKSLGGRLSNSSKVYFPGSSGFTNATTRWSVLDEPEVNVVIVPGTEDDVAEIVRFANKKDIPFLTYNGVHGALTSLGRMTHGIAIYMDQLSSVDIATDGKTATMGGGTMSKTVTDELWAAGKQTVTGTCECVSLLGPALGGGHGWLQGHHGLVLDQFVSMNIVLANGTLTTLDSTSELWWAVKGAGHNFGIVTSITMKIYDIQHRDWAIDTLVFSGDKVGEVYQAANDYLVKNGTQAAGVINWSYWMNDADADPNNPVIVFYIIQEGVTTVDSIYTEPFHAIGPLSATPESGTYKDLAAWTEVADTSPPCEKAGMANPRYPIYLETYDILAQQKAWDVYANATRGSSAFNNSIFMFEGYSVGGVHKIDSRSSAFAFRSENLLAAPLINYYPAGEDLEQRATNLGQELRNILFHGSGREDLRAYVNYAHGDETPQQLYGSEKWRQQRLRTLKEKYDPNGKFSFYAPIP
ncbi:FAD-binding domain-containing protein [Aspergillus heteromorphus CBS 117.55]|uniref:FAD-binding domain-containing protein n=1 Tax=Aspergillus heteromorphus CBS 117.55 TaxID=1448321 RepID=A0A317WX55_9EURO|nr:FAD-binding domain-containing protein [Aspergillus heteromorphus CBS 117.55]PWY89912.1 FAD-binding domain-containing protein [Aspergillus heteromorphus CBS 117.55]